MRYTQRPEEDEVSLWDLKFGALYAKLLNKFERLLETYVAFNEGFQVVSCCHDGLGTKKILVRSVAGARYLSVKLHNLNAHSDTGRCRVYR